MIYIPDLVREIFPEGYYLLPGTNQIYELEFAIAEYKNLNPSELLTRSAYFYKVEDKETYHYRLCADSPLYIDKSSSMRLKSFFKFINLRPDTQLMVFSLIEENFILNLSKP